MKFKVGDNVIIKSVPSTINSNSINITIGKQGVIVQISKHSAYPFYVKFNDINEELHYKEHELAVYAPKLTRI